MFLIPTLAYAEEFVLSCDGEVSGYKNTARKSTFTKETRIVEVTESFLRYEGLRYETDKVDYEGHKSTTSYRKNSNQITALYQAFITGRNFKEEDYKKENFTDIQINRMTGEIYAHLSWGEDKTKASGADVSTFGHSTFKGKCKKQKKAF